MKIRFYNARILSLHQEEEIFEGELWTDEAKISYIGPSQDTADILFDREINLNGNLILPSFKNAHTHSAMTFLRSFADDLPLLEWLEHQVFPMEAKLTDDDVYQLSKLAILEYLQGGCSAAFDMYRHTEAVVQAFADCQFRLVLCGSVNDFSGTNEESLKELERFFTQYNQPGNDMLQYRLGFHAEYTTSAPLLKEIATLAHKYHAPVFTHNSEGLPEVEQCIARHGTTPTVYLDSLGLFEYGGGGYHCVHFSQEDIEVFQKRHLYLITNPASNGKLASGIAPLAKYQQAEIPIAIGTDGPASNNALDIFREMYLACIYQKLSLNDASAMNPIEVLKMATTNAALAMGILNCDSLAVGKKADLMVLDLMQPNMRPLNNLQKNIVYSGNRQNVLYTVVNGNILYEKGEFFIGEDPEKIYHTADAIIRRMTSN